MLLFVGTLAAEQQSTFAAFGAGGDPPFRVGSATNGCVEPRLTVVIPGRMESSSVIENHFNITYFKNVNV
ncbi:hypothetical protein G7043_31555 [Lentzea sp. NEAU-D13]|uniref:Uncharacterized protein n=1 Tax=Lentzea alba TaxID=2714351 RepID=A0A7C9RUW0_9PSEU|nr:hypothetical protein [Lentzea alba]NGY63468.1 hypothetical protein [Lentzea alba]